jgi:hypothetical protein
VRNRTSFSFLLIVGLTRLAGAQCNPNHTCVTDGSEPAVVTALGNAVDGDTIVVPSGQFTWTDKLVITKAVTLQGSTVVTKGADGRPDGGADNAGATVITRKMGSSLALIDITTVAPPKLVRVTGITFKQAPKSPPPPAVQDSLGTGGGYVAINGYGLARVDNCHFIYTGGAGVAEGFRYGDGGRGVIDHNFIESDGTQIFYLENGYGLNSSAVKGNYSWSKGNRAAQDLTYGWGSRDFPFFEDNYIKCGTGQRALTDGSNGCKFVVRHNTIVNARIATHGTEVHERGGRAIEVYLNNFSMAGNWFNNQGDIGGTRDGGVIFWGNNYTYPGGNNFRLACFRISISYNNCLPGAPAGQCVWEGASGRSPWDVNETEGKATHTGNQTGQERPGPTPWPGQTATSGDYNEANHLSPWQYWPLNARTPNVATTPLGTMNPSWLATAGAGTGQFPPTISPPPLYSRIVNSTNPNWKIGGGGSEWNMFGILNLGGGSNGEAMTGHHNQIHETGGATSTSDSVVTDPRNTDKVNNSTINTWGTGSKFQIYKVLVGLDQPGRGAGDLVTGPLFSWVNSTTGTRYWPHDVIDPCYAWLNRGPGGARVNFEAGGVTIHENNEWYGETTTVNPNPVTTGVRVGPKSALPAFGGSVTGVSGYDIAHCTPTVADYAVSGMGDAGVPGTAYWATDVDSINGSSDRGALYVWFKPIVGGVPGTSKWNLWYQPYEYPHPCVKHPDAHGTVAQCLEGVGASPVIDSSNFAQFTEGTTVNCATGVNCLKVTTKNFTGTPTIKVGTNLAHDDNVWTPALTGAQISLTDNHDGTANLSGTLAGVATNTYVSTIRAQAGTQIADQGFQLSVVQRGIPAAPSGLGVTTVSTTQLKLAWTDNSSNETGFKIERSPDNVTFTEIDTVTTNVVTYDNTGLTAGTTYYYRVRATNSSGDSSYSSVASGTTTSAGSPPTAPSALAVGTITATSIKLSWTDNSNNETGFKIERSTDNLTFTEIATTTVNTATYTNSGLTGSTLYYFRVRAYNGGGNSSYTSVVSGTTLAGPTPTPTPTPLPGPKPPPRGTYITSTGFVTTANTPAGSVGTSIDNDNCDGVRYTAKWSDIEQQAFPGTPYSWTALDAAVQYAHDHGKKCGICVTAGKWSPNWLFAPPFSAPSYTLIDTPPPGQGSRVPIPGDTTFMTRWQAFIAALGARYDNDPDVSYVLITGIGNHDEWDLAPGATDTANLSAIMGGDALMVDKWKTAARTIVNAYAAAFPKTTIEGLPVPPFAPNSAEAPLITMKAVSDYAISVHGCRFDFGIAPITSTLTTGNYAPANELFLHWQSTHTHGETRDPATDSADLDAMLGVALGLNIRCMEIYKADFENPDPDFQTIITARRAQLLGVAACPAPVAGPTPASLIISTTP